MWGLVFSGLLLALAIVAFARPAAAAPAPRAVHADTYTFAFQDAEVGQVAQEILGTTLGVSYSIDPAVTGKISFRIDQRLTRAQLLEAFEAALAANGVVMVRNGDSLVLTPRAKAKEQAGLRMLNEGEGQAGYAVVAMPLSYATPSEVAKALETMGRGDMVVYVDDKLGLLMLGGTERELEAARQSLRVLDQSGLQNARMRWFEVEKAPAQTVAGELEQILQGAGIAGVTVIPLRRLNGLLVFARTPQALDQVSQWIEKLDVPSKEEVASLWVYRPRHVAADALATALNSVISGSTGGGSTPAPASPSKSEGGASTASTNAEAPGPATTPAFSGGSSGGDDSVRVGVSKESNALIITAPPSKWVQIKRILDEIDIRPGQVLIEASILEVTLGDDFRFGVNWSALGANGKATFTLSGDSGGAVAPTFPGLAATYIGKDIKAAVDTLKSMTEVEVISAPKLVTLDNHTAKLQVGDQVPVTINSAQSTATANAPLVTTTEYRDTGVILNVTPRISGDDEIVLDVDQEVSSAAETTSSGINSPTIQQRRLQSTLIVKDGGTIALGGLISSDKSKGQSGIPIAGDIPLFGRAFRSDNHKSSRTELIVLMTARIMKDQGSAEGVMKDLLADMQEIENRGLLRH